MSYSTEMALDPNYPMILCLKTRMVEFRNMSSTPPPQVPQFRITLFYGPEKDGATPDTLYCVFNLKKRSWKGGVQVLVEVEEAQLARARQHLNFDEWLNKTLALVPDSERQNYAQLGQDLFVQQICQTKLQLALNVGIRQENSRLASDFLVSELEEALGEDGAQVKAQILRELDVPGESEG